MSHVSPFYFSPRINNLIQKRSLQPLDKILAKRENRAFSTRGLNGDTAAKRRQNAAQGASLGQNAKDQQAPKGAKELLQPNSRTPCHSDRNRSERDGAAEEPASRVRHHKPYRLTYRGRAALQRRVKRIKLSAGFSPRGRALTEDGGSPAFDLRRHHHNRGCPTLRDFRSVGTTDAGSQDLAEAAPAFMRAPVAGGGNEQEVEVHGTHLPKIAEGGAASVVVAQARKDERWANPTRPTHSLRRRQKR
jgi:hypothetical protein